MFEFIAHMSSLEVLLLFVISVLLIIGTISDYKSFEVANWITFGILISSIPLIFLNRNNISSFSFAVLFVFLGAYIYGIGMADLKAVIPLLFIFPDITLFAGCLAIVGIIQFSIEWMHDRAVPIRKIRVPYFLTITLSFFITVLS